jgi:hypothetical protein
MVGRRLSCPEVYVAWASNDDSWAAYGDLSLVARKAGVTVGMVRNWRYRGWLTTDAERRYVRTRGRGYHLADVIDAERDTRLSGQSHRRIPVEAA